MGLFEKIFQKKQAEDVAHAFWKTLNAYTPVFTSWRGSIYESELVRASIDAVARNVSKLKIEILGDTPFKRLEPAPNSFQTWGQFLYRLSTILEVDTTAFIVPILDDYGRTVGVFPILPSTTTLVNYKDEPWIRYQFSNGQVASMELEKCGIMTKFQYRDDFFGDGNSSLTPTMDLIHLQEQGIKEAVKSSATYRFMAQMVNFASEKDLEKERKRFNSGNFQGEGERGMLLFPNTYKDIKQIESKPYVVDAAEMKAIRTNVFDYIGVNEDVLQNKAFGDALGAFYDGKIEPFAIQFSEVLSNMLFTKEDQAKGIKVVASANRLQYMSNAEKRAMSIGFLDRGTLNRDEVREMWNLPPLPNGEGKAYIIRGEYYRAENKLKEE